MYLYSNKTDGNGKWLAVIMLLAANLIVTAVIIVYMLIPSGGGSNGILAFESAEYGQYVLYIGLNDRHTYEQIIPTDEAVEIVNNIFAKHVGGWTMHHARGGWVDETDTLTQENSLVYTVAYANEVAVIAIMDEVLVALNQNSILIERRDISSVFYRGEVRNE
ncbi:MAG: DUF3574 domain-containing protein [Defluviitaleaceae bacterium]|nr:DUF3574 domain-containing protein [Defluviitaleaceae bacterium]